MKIFIDCSHVDFSRQPTGIPRVVLQYIQNGYEWSRTSGVETIPVVTTPSGLLPVRPTPGRNLPEYMKVFDRSPDDLVGEVSKSLDKSCFYLQSALLAAGVDVSNQQCMSSVSQAYRSLANDSDIQPLEISSGDLLFCPAYWHDVPPDLFWNLQRQGCRIVTLVHDVLPITFKKFYQSPWKEQFEKYLKAHILKADAIYAVSNYTANSIKEIAERNGVLETSIGVAHNGYAPLVGTELAEKIRNANFEPILRRGAAYQLLRERQPYLMVGSVEPKKGHIPTIRSFEALWDAGFERPLVVIGRKGWLEESVVFAIEQSRYFDEKLFWFQDFDDVDLFYAYQNSRALVFSSYAEGFGIPMVEAMLSGRPVVAYDTPVNREVLGDHGLFFDCFVDFAKHLMGLEEETSYEKIIEKVGRYSWSEWSEVVPKLLDELVDRFNGK